MNFIGWGSRFNRIGMPPEVRDIVDPLTTAIQTGMYFRHIIFNVVLLYQWHFGGQAGNQLSSEKVVPRVNQQIPPIRDCSVPIKHLECVFDFFSKRCKHNVQ